jgi:hypothetical protein
LRHAQIPLQVYVRETLECVLLYWDRRGHESVCVPESNYI